MISTNRERVGKALDLLKAGLGPFVERELRSVYGTEAQSQARQSLSLVQERRLANRPVAQWDIQALLKLMRHAWHGVFSNVLRPADKHLVHELQDPRNDWAHQETFSNDDAYRILDSTARLLTAVSAPQASEVENMKSELGRLIYAQPMRSEKNKAEDKEYPCPIPGCQKVFNGSRGGWDAHIGSLKKHPEWHPEIDDPEGRKARFKAEFTDWFTRD